MVVFVCLCLCGYAFACMRCGGVRCGGEAVWRCVGVAVRRCGCVEVRWCGGVEVRWCGGRRGLKCILIVMFTCFPIIIDVT